MIPKIWRFVGFAFLVLVALYLIRADHAYAGWADMWRWWMGW